MHAASVPDDPYQAIGVVAILAAPILMVVLVALYDRYRGGGRVAKQFQEMVDRWFAPVSKQRSLIPKAAVALILLVAAPVLLVMFYVLAILVVLIEVVLIGGIFYGAVWVVSLPFPDYTMPLVVVIATAAVIYVAALAASTLLMADAE